MATIISHFYNEEYLLPFWLKHHRKYFDHGVMINYRSTDNSVAIIKELCPTWEIIDTRNPDFLATAVDSEVYDIEKNIQGWRICLNTTEFLLGNYKLLTDTPNQQYTIASYNMVDVDPTIQPTQEQELWETKHHGMDYVQYFGERRARSMHNYSVNYPTGRHFTNYNTTELAILYYGWAPFNDSVIARKLQIQNNIPEFDKRLGHGAQHITTRDKLIQDLNNKYVPISIDLKEKITELCRK